MSEQNENKLDRIFKGLIFLGIFGLLDLILFGVFGYAGNFVKNFLIGVFGYAIYGYSLAGTLASVFTMLSMKPSVSFKIILNYFAIIFVIIAIAHIVTYKEFSSQSYSDYLNTIYSNHDSIAGVVYAAILYPLAKLPTLSIVFLSLFLVGLIVLVIVNQLNFEIGLKVRNVGRNSSTVVNYDSQQDMEENYSDGYDTYPEVELYNGDINGKLFSSGKVKPGRRNEVSEIVPIEEVVSSQMSAEDKDDLISSLDLNTSELDAEIRLAQQRAENFMTASPVVPITPVEEKKEENKAPIEISEEDKMYFNQHRKNPENTTRSKPDFIVKPDYNPLYDESQIIYNKQNNDSDFDPFKKLMEDYVQQEEKEDINTNNSPIDDLVEEQEEKIEDKTEYGYDRPESIEDILKKNAEEQRRKEAEQKAAEAEKEIKNYTSPISQPRTIKENPIFKDKKENKVEKEIEKPKPIEKPKRIIKPYKAPDVSKLADIEMQVIDPAEIEEKAQDLKKTLAAFKVNVELEDNIIGPTFSRIRFRLETGTPVKNLTSRVDDIKLGLAVQSMRLLAPIPGTNLCGIEIPNRIRNMVPYKDVYLSEEYQKAIKKPTGLVFAFGKDIDGKSYSFDLTTAPHMLIAGATRSGKSVAINVMLASLLCRYSPEDLRLILFDPKQVEFLPYTGIPHLLIPQILTEPGKAINAMNWAIQEMERRYALMSANGVRDIDSYNKKQFVIDDPTLHIPYIVIVIDEFGEVATSAYKKQFNETIQRLAAKARAAGIHLVLATQRPSVDIITGSIKTNLPTRMALKTTSPIDSMTILGQGGSEELLGYGDMLFSNPYDSDLKRVQGAYLSTEDLEEMISYIKKNNENFFDEEAEKMILKDNEAEAQEKNGDESSRKRSVEYESGWVDSIEACIEAGSVSTSKIQTLMGYGYPKAAKIFLWMQRNGYVVDEGRIKKIKITTEEIQRLRENLENGGDEED